MASLGGLLAHIVIATIVGGIVAYFTDLRWITASLWSSAAAFIIGTVAVYEDALPGGFDNEEGSETLEEVRGGRGLWFWTYSLAIALALFVAGFWFQWR